MRSMIRLLAVRALQEKAAEQDMAVAHFAAKTAADDLRALESHQLEIRRMTSEKLGAGDSQQAYISILEYGLQNAMRPGMERRVAHAEICCGRMKALWLQARCEHAAIQEIVRVQREHQRRALDKAAQASADEIYRGRRKRTPCKTKTMTVEAAEKGPGRIL